ncbi:hypothetical protein U1Q18_011468 [Sarracenia purpurea var. burkii]
MPLLRNDVEYLECKKQEMLQTSRCFQSVRGGGYQVPHLRVLLGFWWGGGVSWGFGWGVVVSAWVCLGGCFFLGLAGGGLFSAAACVCGAFGGWWPWVVCSLGLVRVGIGCCYPCCLSSVLVCLAAGGVMGSWGAILVWWLLLLRVCGASGVSSCLGKSVVWAWSGLGLAWMLLLLQKFSWVVCGVCEGVEHGFCFDVAAGVFVCNLRVGSSTFY